MEQPVQAQGPQSVLETPTLPETPETITPVTPSTPETELKPSRKFPIIIIILLVLILAGGMLIYLFSQRKRLDQPTPTTKQQVSIPSPTPTTQPQVSHYIGSQTITLRDLTGGTSSGTVTRNVGPDSASVSLDASLPDLVEGQFYQGWLLRTEKSYVSIGKLSINDQGLYIVLTDFTFSPSDTFTFSDLNNTVVVSLEAVDDNVMETKILEGIFTE